MMAVLSVHTFKHLSWWLCYLYIHSNICHDGCAICTYIQASAMMAVLSVHTFKHPPWWLYYLYIHSSIRRGGCAICTYIQTSAMMAVTLSIHSSICRYDRAICSYIQALEFLPWSICKYAVGKMNMCTQYQIVKPKLSNPKTLIGEPLQIWWYHKSRLL